MPDVRYAIATGPGMGRSLVLHDERSRGFRAVDLTDATKPRTWEWSRGGAYDQGKTSECVAYTGKGILNSAPLNVLVPYRVRSVYKTAEFYTGAQRFDEWPGADYAGTSGLGLCRYLASVHLIREYRWAFGVAELLLALSWVGPVGIGVQWRAGMVTPDSNGAIRATGSDVGGHEVELTGLDIAQRTVTVTNSWGQSWGNRGRAHLPVRDLADLLARDGDAFVVVA